MIVLPTIIDRDGGTPLRAVYFRDLKSADDAERGLADRDLLAPCSLSLHANGST